LLNIERPWLRGDALYEEIERWKPALSERVAFISGDTEKVEISAFLEEAGRPYLWKPFSIWDLQDMVVELMQGEHQFAMPNIPEGGVAGALAERARQCGMAGSYHRETLSDELWCVSAESKY
ncbi:MAG: hypothetical protein KAJ81_04555, partial [Candidatus Latescibacteria bacterium]|nr:hypothetical protein [Candidatus Latescibacterota bacterium]